MKNHNLLRILFNLSKISVIFSLALNIKLNYFDISFTDISNLFFKSVDFYHELFENLCPFLIFIEVLLFLFQVFLHQLLILLFPLSRLLTGFFRVRFCILLKFHHFFIYFIQIWKKLLLSVLKCELILFKFRWYT